MKPISVLFVCSGNICRSPTAQGIFESVLDKKGFLEAVKVDSAGLNKLHTGESPDKRAQRCAISHGYDISGQKTRSVKETDFADFDYILAMDKNHLTLLKRYCPEEHEHKMNLFLEFTKGLLDKEVPDPYYGKKQDFDNVLKLCEMGVKSLLEHLRKNHRI